MTTQILGVSPRFSNRRSLAASAFFEVLWWKGSESAAVMHVPVEVTEGSSEATETPARSSGGIPAELAEARSCWPMHTWNNCALATTNTEVRETEGTFNLNKIWHRTICFSCQSIVHGNKWSFLAQTKIRPAPWMYERLLQYQPKDSSGKVSVTTKLRPTLNSPAATWSGSLENAVAENSMEKHKDN